MKADALPIGGSKKMIQFFGESDYISRLPCATASTELIEPQQKECRGQEEERTLHGGR